MHKDGYLQHEHRRDGAGQEHQASHVQRLEVNDREDRREQLQEFILVLLSHICRTYVNQI